MWTAMHKCFKSVLFVGCAATLNYGFISTSMASTIPITNAGFEDPAVALGRFTTSDIPGWTTIFTGSPDDRVGVFHPPSDFLGGVPEGDQVGYSNGPTLSQVVSENLVADTPYRLTVDIGNRQLTPIDGYEVQLLAGSTVLGFVDETMILPDLETFRTVTVSFKADSANPAIGQPLEIRLFSDAAQVIFDNVNLETVPVPPAALLFGSGLLGLVGIARRKKAV
jgi:hypothetical protein